MWSEGKIFEDLIADEAASKEMENFIIWYTIDIIAYTCEAIFHSAFIIGSGYATAVLIMMYMAQHEATYSGGSIIIAKGFKSLLFGVLMGTAGYFGGNVTTNTMSSVMKALGMIYEYYSENTEV